MELVKPAQKQTDPRLASLLSSFVRPDWPAGYQKLTPEITVGRLEPSQLFVVIIFSIDEIMITRNNKISYFGFNFIRKSTLKFLLFNNF